MGIRKEELHNLIDRLKEHDQQKAYEFLTRLVNTPTDLELEAFWSAIESLEPDDIPLSKEEKEQLDCDEYISWEELKRESGIKSI